MSLKPDKKSDLGKGWMRKRRDRAVRIQPEYHLIVTEGTKTEPNYFSSIKEAINSHYKGKIQLDIRGEGDNTLNLMDRAVRLTQESPNVYRHVWVVYDTDDFPADSVNRVPLLCEKYSNEETCFHAAWSNQCIELWYLLHFSYMQSDIHRSEYRAKLDESMHMVGAGDYAKNRTDMYQVLLPFMDTALANAKQLNAANTGKEPSASAPGTKVYELIEMLMPYLRDQGSVDK